MPLSRELVPRVVSFVQANRQHFANSGPAVSENYYSEAFWLAKAEELEQAECAGTSLHRWLVLREDRARVIGKCAISAIQRGPFQAAYLGYGLDEAHVGSGYMTEALGAFIEHMFGVANLHHIMANYMPSNARSEAVLTRLGFVREGIAKDYLYIAGRWEDHVLTSLVNPDWKPVEN